MVILFLIFASPLTFAEPVCSADKALKEWSAIRRHTHELISEFYFWNPTPVPEVYLKESRNLRLGRFDTRFLEGFDRPRPGGQVDCQSQAPVRVSPAPSDINCGHYMNLARKALALASEWRLEMANLNQAVAGENVEKAGLHHQSLQDIQDRLRTIFSDADIFDRSVVREFEWELNKVYQSVRFFQVRPVDGGEWYPVEHLQVSNPELMVFGRYFPESFRFQLQGNRLRIRQRQTPFEACLLTGGYIFDVVLDQNDFYRLRGGAE